MVVAALPSAVSCDNLLPGTPSVTRPMDMARNNMLSEVSIKQAQPLGKLNISIASQRWETNHTAFVTSKR
jgi:hypothetical protein